MGQPFYPLLFPVDGPLFPIPPFLFPHHVANFRADGHCFPGLKLWSVVLMWPTQGLGVQFSEQIEQSSGSKALVLEVRDSPLPTAPAMCAAAMPCAQHFTVIGL